MGGNVELRVALRRGDLREAQRALDLGAKVNPTGEVKWGPLHEAASLGHTDIVRELLSRGADPAIGDFMLPLHVASQNGHAEVVQLLLKHGADVNAKSPLMLFTPLHWAASGGHSDVVRILIQSGADLNLRNEFQNTPLHEAVLNEHADVVRIFINENPDISAVDGDGHTARQLAEANGYSALAEMLRVAEQQLGPHAAKVQRQRSSDDELPPH